MKKNIYCSIIQTLVLLFLIKLEIYAQPFFFYQELNSLNYNDIYRINLSNGEKDLFISNIENPFTFACDNYQKYFILSNKYGISIYSPNNPTVIDSILPDGNYVIGISVFSVPEQNSLYLSWFEKNDSDIIQNTDLLSLTSLQKIKECSVSIDEKAFMSKNSSFIYQLGLDTTGERYFEKYSINSDSIIDNQYFNDIFSNNSFVNYKFGKSGSALFAYNTVESDILTKKYIVYDLDNELFSAEISFPFRSYGYLSTNADFIILEKALWDTTKNSDENLNGEISIYKTSTCELIKNYNLPPGGKLLIFDSFSHNVYYVTNFLTQPEVYILLKPKLHSITPPLALPYYATPIEPNVLTITVTGEFFTDSTIVYYNGNAKPTTFISDSVLTINLNSIDFRFAGNYPIWVSNYGSVSDTMYLSVVNSLPERIIPTLQCIVSNPDKTYTAYFGYNNQNTVPVGIVSRSDYNYFTPGDRYRGQPNIFQPGNHPNVFSTVFDGKNLYWVLTGGRILANKYSNPCD